jgi:amino acid transporter
MTTLAAAPVRRMTLVPLVGALYFMVSGGPYGLEELAHDVGFRAAIAVLAVVPIVWSLPTALMVGELAAALPDEGGYYAWVRRALGPFWGFQEAWLSLAASVFDMAIYPTLFVLYLGRLAPALATWPFALAIGVLVVAAAAGWNLVGARAVGDGSAVTTALLLGPFVVLSVLATFRAHGGAPAVTLPAPAQPDWAAGVLVAMWNFMGWDNASTVAAEVDRPQYTYPRAVLAAVALVAATYIVPFAAMAAAGVDPAAWDTGAWADTARSIGGPALGLSVVVGGMASAFAMNGALCLSYSRVPLALADDGYLPRAFTRRTARGGAPWVSILVCSLAWTLSLGLPFDRLLSLDILLYGTSLVLEFVALVVLRVREPGLPRPFRVPGGLAVAALLGVGPLALLSFALVKSADERVGPLPAMVFGVGWIATGPVLYAVADRGRRARSRPEGVATMR